MIEFWLIISSFSVQITTFYPTDMGKVYKANLSAKQLCAMIGHDWKKNVYGFKSCWATAMMPPGANYTVCTERCSRCGKKRKVRRRSEDVIEYWEVE